MGFLRSTIHNYGDVIQIWHVLGLCISVLILFFPGKMKKMITVYLCCYAGIIFGALAGFRLFYHPAGFFAFALAGTGILLALCFSQIWGFDFVAAWIVVAKIALIFWSTGADEMTGTILFTCIFVGLLFGAAVGISSRELTDRHRNAVRILLCSLFGICELAGTVVALYCFPLESNLKFLQSKKEYCNYFSTWMNCDFVIAGKQEIFLALLFLTAIMEMVVLTVWFVKKRADFLNNP